MTRYYDKNKRPIYHGDILKVYHFTGARKKKYYMYKLVVQRGEHFYGINIVDLADKSLDSAHSYNIRFSENNLILEDTEIIAGHGGVDGFGLSYEDREKLK